MTDYERGYEQGKEDAKKKWVGLTEDEVRDFQVNKFVGPNIIRAIERRLKEKNG